MLFRSGAENSKSRRKLHTNQGAHGHRHSSARREDHCLRLREGGCCVKSRRELGEWIRLNPYFPNRRQPTITTEKAFISTNSVRAKQNGVDVQSQSVAGVGESVATINANGSAYRN